MELAKAHSWQGTERRKGSEAKMSLVGTQGQGPGDPSVRVEYTHRGPGIQEPSGHSLLLRTLA